jgi:hypothetical protein
MVVDWIPADGFPEGEIASIHRLKPDILACARRHNTVKTNMDENAFAALMTAILHWEGRLPGNAKPFWGPGGVGDISGGQIRDILGDLAGLFGADVTTGIANIRPSVAFEILKGEIPGFQGRYCYNIEGGTTYDDIRNNPFRGLTLFNELQKEKVSLEYLAANLERGADRINTLGFQASVFNLAAWHNTGVQTRDEFRDPQIGPKAQSYANVILSTMPTALRVLGVQGRYLPYNSFEAEFVDAHLRARR